MLIYNNSLISPLFPLQEANMRRAFKSAKQSPDKDDRLPIVANLYQLGLKPNEIAFLLFCSNGTIRNDLDDLGGTSSFKTRPTSRQNIFKAIFYEYAWIIQEKIANRWNSHIKIMEMCLAQWLEIDQIILMLQALTDQLLLIQPDKPENQGYIDLLYELFPQIYANIQQTRMHFLRQYFKMVVEKRLRTPRSYNDLTEQLASLACASWRPHIPPAWTDQTTRVIDQWLGKISFEERQLIHKRFGLGTTPMSLKVIGMQYDITYQAAGHRIKMIIAILKNQIDPQQVQLFLQPSYLVSASILDADQKKHILDSEIEILRLPLVLERRLKRHGILWVNELVQKSESELEEIFRRLRKLNIQLIKRALRIHGLTLREPKTGQGASIDSLFSNLPDYLAKRLVMHDIPDIDTLASETVLYFLGIPHIGPKKIEILRKFLEAHGRQFAE